MIFLTCCLSIADREWVSRVSRITHTVGVVVAYGAGSVGATDTGTGVTAFVVHACKMVGTLWVDCALVFAFNVRITLQSW